MTRRTDKKTFKDALTLYGTSALIVIIGFAITFHFVEPAPPKTITMATGSANNVYHQLGLQYQAALKAEGVNLELITTEGSVENLKKLENKKVDIAFIQSGIKEQPNEQLEALGSLYYEPLWLFHQASLNFDYLHELKGKHVAVGQLGSGTYPVALSILADNGIDTNNTTLYNLSTTEAISKLQQGTIDAAFIVTGPQNPNIKKLLDDSSVSLYSFQRAEAYNRLHPFLSSVMLPAGVMDMIKNTPKSNIQLIAPTATLVIDQDFHPALTSLVLQVATKIHSNGGILEPVGAFPSAQFIDFPLNSDAKRFYKSGPPFLQRYMPFWLANLVDRLIVLLIPLLTLMIPLVKVLPPTYRWRIRSRIYRWYDQLREIEYQSESSEEYKQIETLLNELHSIEKELMMTDIPKSYAESQYNLRLHIRLIRERLEWKLKQPTTK